MAESNDENQPPADSALTHRLADAWHQGRQEFFVLLTEELIPKVQLYLQRNFPSLSDEDLEDCIFAAVANFIKRDDRSIENPGAYLWQMAKNETFDLVEERASTRELGNSTNKRKAEEIIDDRTATILIEGLVEDAEADASWAIEVVTVAVSRLRPALQRVILYVLAHGTDCDTTVAAAELGTTPATFRANKSNGYSALRSLIPVVIAEKGIVLPSPRLVEVFTTGHEFASSDD